MFGIVLKFILDFNRNNYSAWDVMLDIKADSIPKNKNVYKPQ